MQYPIIHIVRRFGRVGGMESYVWWLVHGLALRDVGVIVVCELVCEPPGENIEIIQVDTSLAKSRWKSMMMFRSRVSQKIRDEFRGQKVLIHSHERSIGHQVTTFHGPPIEPPKGFGWLSRLNRRVSKWQQMERDELLGEGVQMILPVSSGIQKQLMNRYPEITNKRIDLAWPGVLGCSMDSKLYIEKCSAQEKFLFVGKEWKRKGLDIAMRAVTEFRKSNTGATLTVFGVDKFEIPYSMRAYKWVHFKGWSNEIPWSDFDVLLHPARKEPFGMVIAEARSFGLPVVMSSKVGAADLGFTETKILDVSAHPAQWCQAAKDLIRDNKRKAEIKWSLDDLVQKHMRTIYPQLDPIWL